MLQTVIRNLTSNAIKFTPRGGTISIFAGLHGQDKIVISIQDSGIGMCSELSENIFRIDARKSRQGTEDEPGSGLGLILCKEFINKNNGKIWVESEINKGSTFYFTLPKA